MAEPISRRSVIGAVWAAPVIAVAVAAPSASASGNGLRAVLVTTSLGADGYAFNLRDGKVLNPAGNTNTNRLNTTVVIATFTVVDDVTNLPIPGAAFTIEGGSLLDGEGNFVIAIVPMSTTGNVTESPVQRTVTSTTDAAGQFQVKIATATWSVAACPVGYVGPFQPPSGAITVSMTAMGHTPSSTVFSALVNDVSTPVTCG